MPSAAALNEPMLCVKGAVRIGMDSFVSFDNSLVELDAVKKSEDGRHIVLRFHEFSGSRQRVGVSTGFAYKTWAESDLRERALEAEHRGAIALTLHPYEIKTILLTV